MTDGQMRRALVIGAGSGMGRAVAQRLHQDGYQLALADLRRESLGELAEQLGAPAHAVDIADPASLADLAAACREGLDALVVTAGLSMSMAPFARVLQVNLGGSARALEAFAPVMRRGGAAVLLASMAGHLAGPLPAALIAAVDAPLADDLAERVAAELPAEQQVSGMAYALSKLGVLRLTQRSAAAWGRLGLRVCSVSPGLIDTPMGALEREASDTADAALPLGPIPRLGAPEEVANVIAFLASPQASYVTGCDLLVDGGWSGEIQTSPHSPLAVALADGRAKN
jgi:NAD(P)-dependent dehydrogenase (short-subunit alcohol dehydrogenase family)